MSKHSKNNTARGFFTYEEKKKLKYGTIRVCVFSSICGCALEYRRDLGHLILCHLNEQQRLGRDSLRNFDSCFLCLQTAQNPLSCTEGHIACKECLYENIMAQKTEAQRLAKLYEAQESLEEVRSINSTKLMLHKLTTYFPVYW